MVVTTEEKMNDNQLRGLRQIRRLSLNEAAKESGLDPALLSKVERGIVRPSARVRAALVELFDMPEHILFPGAAAGREKRS